MTNVFAGVMPALMTPCKPDRTPDFRALTRKGRELIEAGMSAVVYCGSMGDWPLLTDEQRMEGVEHLVDAGVPVIVGTGAQNSQRAAALARHAKKVGAKGLMIIPRVLSRGASPAAQRAHFAGVLEAAVDLPSVIYNSPYYGFQTRAELFFELRRSCAAPRRLQGIRRRRVAQLRRRTHRRRLAGYLAVGRRRHPSIPRLRQLRGCGRDHRHRQRAAQGNPAPRLALPARREGRPASRGGWLSSSTARSPRCRLSTKEPISCSISST